MTNAGNTDTYTEDERQGKNWRMMLGDSCERLGELEDNSIDMSVCSPPFASLFTYSASNRDLGNCATRIEFIEHYRFIVEHQLRVTKPGRIACIHVQQLTNSKATYGEMSMHDFRGDVIRLFQDVGWLFWGETTIWKDPQAQSIRTRSHQLAFASKNRDSARIRPALADYLLIFKKPGDNEVKIENDPNSGEFTNEQWIEWASPIWQDHHDGGWLTDDGNVCPVWYGIKESDTLNYKSAREKSDERHIAPLQLGFIERCIKMYSNPNETILTPFGGIGSELYVAVKFGRRAIGCELKQSYWAQAVKNLQELEQQMEEPDLFSF